MSSNMDMDMEMASGVGWESGSGRGKYPVRMHVAKRKYGSVRRSMIKTEKEANETKLHARMEFCAQDVAKADQPQAQSPSLSFKTYKQVNEQVGPIHSVLQSSTCSSTITKSSGSSYSLACTVSPSAPALSDSMSGRKIKAKPNVRRVNASAVMAQMKSKPNEVSTLEPAARIVGLPRSIHSAPRSPRKNTITPTSNHPASKPTTSYPPSPFLVSPTTSPLPSDRTIRIKPKHHPFQTPLESDKTAKHQPTQLQKEVGKCSPPAPTTSKSSDPTRPVVPCKPRIPYNSINRFKPSRSPAQLKAVVASARLSIRLAWRKKRQASPRIIVQTTSQLGSTQQTDSSNLSYRKNPHFMNETRTMTGIGKDHSKKKAKKMGADGSTISASAGERDKIGAGSANVLDESDARRVAKSRRHRKKTKSSSNMQDIVAHETDRQKLANQTRAMQQTRAQTATGSVIDAITTDAEGCRANRDAGRSDVVVTIQVTAADKQVLAEKPSPSQSHRSSAVLLTQPTPPQRDVDQQDLHLTSDSGENGIKSVGSTEGSILARKKINVSKTSSMSDKIQVEATPGSVCVTQNDSTDRNVTAPVESAVPCAAGISAKTSLPTNGVATPAQAQKQARGALEASEKTQDSPASHLQGGASRDGTLPASGGLSADIQLNSTVKCANVQSTEPSKGILTLVSSLDTALLHHYIDIPTTADLLKKPSGRERSTGVDSEDDITCVAVRPKHGPGKPKKRVVSQSDEDEQLIVDTLTVRPKRKCAMTRKDYVDIYPGAPVCNRRVGRKRQEDVVIDDDFELHYSDLERLENENTAIGHVQEPPGSVVDTVGDCNYTQVASVRNPKAVEKKKLHRENSARRSKGLSKAARNQRPPSPALLNVYSQDVCPQDVSTQDVCQSRQPSAIGSSKPGKAAHTDTHRYSPLSSCTEEPMAAEYLASLYEPTPSESQMQPCTQRWPEPPLMRQTHSPSPPRGSQTTTLEQRILSDVEQMKQAFGKSSLHFVRGQQAYDRVAFNLAGVDKPSPGKGNRINAYAEFMAQFTRWINVNAAAIERMLKYGGAPTEEIPFEEVRPPPRAGQ